MSDKLTRRDFLKLTGVGALTTAVLTGCGPASRYVVRKPYTSMPEFNQTGVSTYYATTCRDCPAGCGLIVRTFSGRAIKIEGNPDHPVNRGKICSRGLTGVQGLYNPDRIQAPQKQARGGGAVEPLQWDAAVQVVADALQDAGSAAFLLGETPDHLFDLVQEMSSSMGTLPPVRYNIMSLLNGADTLRAASQAVYGTVLPPFFDLENADLVFSFGANFLESWLAPVSYSRAYGRFRQGDPDKRGYLVSFEPRMSLTSGVADQWIPVAPGTEGMVAAAIGNLISEVRGTGGQIVFGDMDLADVAQASGVSEQTLRDLAARFTRAQRPLAIPGSSIAAHANGLEAVEAVLLLNSLANNQDTPGGIFFPPPAIQDTAPAGSEADAAGTQPAFSAISSLIDLVDRMKSGDVQTLFIHGVNPLFDLPGGLGFAEALANVPLVISFASFPDETAMQSDYIFPDHSGLESFGYQKSSPGSDRPLVSAMQPVVAPMYSTRSTVDVLLAAAGGSLPYSDEVDFIQTRISALVDQSIGTFSSSSVLGFWAQFLQYGGWWTREVVQAGPQASETEETSADTGDEENGEQVAVGGAVMQAQPIPPPVTRQEGQYHLVVYTGLFGDGSVANRPWIQETPSPMTTVMWNSWVEINPETAAELGIHDDDIVKITSPAGEVEAVVYLYPAVRPDTVAIPFGQGHTALGQYAQGRGVNPAPLLGNTQNGANDLASGDVLVTITPTGQRRPISRLESREGVYGERH